MSEKTAVKLSGLILIGGRSSRMGRPKHLISCDNGETWLEKNVKMLQPFVDQIFLSGGGEVPDSLASLVRIDDAEGYQGPMAGIVGAMEKYPNRDWLVMACDMPLASAEAVAWLVEQYHQAANCDALIPKNMATGKLESLFAVYGRKASALFKAAAEAGRFSLRSICEGERIVSPQIPAGLSGNWANVNDERQLEALFRISGTW